ncbi:membrane-bound O-acyltransferase family protein [Seonamhaeicola sp. S2-3]|uniref:MBOAT family O-acyltransferase n=1 Tax=Seonamhaeicola sp. S2-3 TaxID=1936081 RepID=UPI000972E9D1|nr:MBOAT family O-acyltransferase [Seonamhaeicola sp. S2-3]APY12409.1 membrane-bound O-acyltransferase family protein [Seonamhaeicola sp. S2-3]
MLFNSLEFFIFLPIVFILYWFVLNKKINQQNVLLLIASYVFYGWWDYRFLSLIALSTLVDYFVGISIDKSPVKSTKRKWLIVSIVFNLGLLGFFKYYNFFLESWVELLNSIGYNIKNHWTLKVILPVGISFYTFQTMSYSIDIYKGKLKSTKNFIAFAAFVSFFPQLVAGPIERASNLLPQILKNRKFNKINAISGIQQIIWGMFKKVAVADSLAPIVNDIFSNYNDYSGGTLITGAVFFAVQIYCDFSGYSDIAIGTAKLFGFDLMTNFNFPYFSKSIGEFWRKWHISLSTWFRDYLYIPLGGSKVGKIKGVRNVFVIFLVSGFWHGANWTFIAWGAIHALLFIPSFILGTNRNYLVQTSSKVNMFQYFKNLIKIIYTFFVVTIAWVFFRAATIQDSFNYILKINSFKLDSFSLISVSDWFIVITLFIMDYVMFKKIKINIFFWVIMVIVILGALNRETQSEFIYFQF